MSETLYTWWKLWDTSVCIRDSGNVYTRDSGDVYVRDSGDVYMHIEYWLCIIDIWCITIAVEYYCIRVMCS